MYKSYKDYFDQYFSDTSKFKVENNLEGAIQRDVVRLLPPQPRLIVELLYVVDNGNYQHLFDIRFKHGQSIGYAKWQNENTLGFGNRFTGFSLVRLEEAIALLEERLSLGWTEIVYSKNGEHYKSKIILPSHHSPRILIWRKEAKGLGHILASTLFSKIYYLVNRKIKIEKRVIEGLGSK